LVNTENIPGDFSTDVHPFVEDGGAFGKEMRGCRRLAISATPL
jgi:hypothetical protein